MAKLARLMNENITLKKEIKAWAKAYEELTIKYREIYEKYSYEETMEKVKKIEQIRKEERNVSWEKIKEENMIKEK